MFSEPTGWEISCDAPGCRERYHVDDDPLDVNTMFEWLKEDGWQTDGLWVRCPDHVEALD